MTRPELATAAVRSDGTVFTERCTADAYGATIPPTATADELAALAAAGSPDPDAVAWVRGDIALALRARHGDDWPDHIPTVGRRPVSIKAWRNAATVADAWPARETRRLLGVQGLAHGHFAAAAALAKRDPDAAVATMYDAVGKGWTIRQLRRVVKGLSPDVPAAAGPGGRAGAITAAILSWADAEGLDDWPSEGQAASLASAILEALAIHERQPATQAPPEYWPTFPETTQGDDDHALPFDPGQVGYELAEDVTR